MFRYIVNEYPEPESKVREIKRRTRKKVHCRVEDPDSFRGVTGKGKHSGGVQERGHQSECILQVE